MRAKFILDFAEKHSGEKRQNVHLWIYLSDPLAERARFFRIFLDNIPHYMQYIFNSAQYRLAKKDFEKLYYKR